MEYTDEQRDVIEKCLTYLNTPNDPRPHFTLTGAPGTGKTVSVRGILKEVRGKRIAAATISHVAKNILSESLSGLNIQVMTVAQLLGSVPNMNKSEKNVKFTVNSQISRIGQFDIIVIDETSMIDDYLFGLLLEYRANNSKIIFIGDKNQLPPVDSVEGDSPTLNVIDAELTKVMRFKEPISHLVEEAKAQLEQLNKGQAADPHFINTKFGKNGRKSKMDGDSGYIFLQKNSDLFDLFIKEYNLYPNDINNTRILMYRNEYVDLANHEIRRRLYGNNLKQFEIGELIVSKGGYRKGKSPVVHNRETYKVKSYEEGFKVGKVPCINLILEPRPHQSVSILTPSIEKGGMKIYNEELARIKEQCIQTRQWGNFHRYKAQFSWWDYTYAQNLYLAQGKTYNSVFVVESEIQDVKPLKTRHKLQALYVGLSRAKERLYIYNKKYKSDGSSYTQSEDFTKLFNN